MLSLEKVNKDSYPYVRIECEDKKDDLHGEIIYMTPDIPDDNSNLKSSFLLCLMSEPHQLSLAEAKKAIKKVAETDYKPCTVFARKDLKLRLIPELKDKQSHRMYLFAPPGSGKSYFIGQYLRQFNHFLPNNEIYLFSLKPEDDAFHGIENMKRIKLEKCATNVLDYTEFPPDSLIIADDCLNIPDENIRNNVIKMMNAVINVGRSRGCGAIMTSHKGKNSKPVDVIINSATNYVLFPRGRRGANADFIYDKIGMFERKSKEAERLLDLAKERKAWNLVLSVNKPESVLMDDYLEILE